MANLKDIGSYNRTITVPTSVTPARRHEEATSNSPETEPYP